MESARGMLLFVGVFALCCVGSANFILLDGLLTRFSWFDFIVSSIALSIGNIVTFFVFLQCLRGELFRPIDEPTIFDRKHRKVYRIFSDVQEGWMGLLKSWPLKVGIYDWDLVKAEHHVAIHATGSTLMRHHALVFSIRKSTHDNTIVNGFMLGNSIHHGELTVPAVYEHVRRFMEEDGPHLPAGGKATSIDTPSSFFQCMARSGPYGQSFHKWWGNARLLTVLWILFFPITLPIFTLIGLFSWFGYATAIPINWPSEVLMAVGEPTNEEIDTSVSD